LDELADVVGFQAGVLGLVLDHLIFQTDQSQARNVLLAHSEVLQDADVILVIGVDRNEQNLEVRKLDIQRIATESV